MQSKNSNAVSSLGKQYPNFTFKLKISLNSENLTKNHQNSLMAKSDCDFSNIYETNLKKLEQISKISSISLSFPESLFQQLLYPFIIPFVEKIESLKKQESMLPITYVEKGKITPWQIFYYDNFFYDVFEKETNCSFSPKNKDIPQDEAYLAYLNHILQNIYLNFSDFHGFVFLEDSPEYSFHLRRIQHFMKTFAGSMEKLFLNLQSAFFGAIHYIPLFMEIENMKNLKSMRVLIAEDERAGSKGIRQITDVMNSIFEKNGLAHLKDFGLCFTDNWDWDSEDKIRKFINLVCIILPKLHSVSFLYQFNLNIDIKFQIEEILKLLFMTHSETIREMTLGFSVKPTYLVFPSILIFDLDVFGKLFIENDWKLTKFNLYLEVGWEVPKNEIKNFLMILMKRQTFLTHCDIKIMKNGKDLIENFGFREVLGYMKKIKETMIYMSLMMKKARKFYRREVINEIMELML